MPCYKAPDPRIFSPDVREALLHGQYRRLCDGVDGFRAYHDGEVAEHPELLDPPGSSTTDASRITESQRYVLSAYDPERLRS
jgi:hypothetical protein